MGVEYRVQRNLRTMQNQTTRTNKRITMGYHDITPEHLQRLHELADLQHPHLKGDNHTRMLIDKVYNREQLTISEAFDCRKYYQRMLEQLNEDKSLNDHLSAILSFKWNVR